MTRLLFFILFFTIYSHAFLIELSISPILSIGPSSSTKYDDKGWEATYPASDFFADQNNDANLLVKSKVGFSPYDLGLDLDGNLFFEYGIEKSKYIKTRHSYLVDKKYDDQNIIENHKTKYHMFGFGFGYSLPHMICSFSVGAEYLQDNNKVKPYMATELGGFFSTTNPRNYSGIETALYMYISTRRAALGIVFGIHYNGSKESFSDRKLQEKQNDENELLFWTTLGLGMGLSSGSSGNNDAEIHLYTAICNDGTYSESQTRSGTCSWHGGVREWLN